MVSLFTVHLFSLSLSFINSIYIMYLNHHRFACDFIQNDNIMWILIFVCIIVGWMEFMNANCTFEQHEHGTNESETSANGKKSNKTKQIRKYTHGTFMCWLKPKNTIKYACICTQTDRDRKIEREKKRDLERQFTVRHVGVSIGFEYTIICQK